jgi:hypothetical protein
MLLTILFAMATIAALVGAIAGIVYPFKCKALEQHLASPLPEYKEDSAAYGAWYKKRWALDKMRLHTGLYAIIAYAVGMFSLLAVQGLLKSADIQTHAPFILMLVLSAGLVFVSVRSTTHNSRESSLDLKRRYPRGL